MSRDANKERLDLLKEFLTEELKSDKPGLLYIEDLKESIRDLEWRMSRPEFQMVT